MKKYYLALLCIVSLLLMTACGGNKPANAEEENTEITENAEEQNDEATDEEATVGEEAIVSPAEAKALDMEALYANGDFKPAEGVVFEDNLSDDEAGELPTKWNILEGSAEVSACGDRNIIECSGSSVIMTPLLNGKSDFLTDVWNLEYEFYRTNEEPMYIRFFNAEGDELSAANVYSGSISYEFTKTDDNRINGEKPDLEKELGSSWAHIAISFNKGNAKIFLNGKRIANLANIAQPTSFTINGQEGLYIANIRVTK